jgi:hypothetical protein
MIKTYFVTGIVATGFFAGWMGCSSNSGGGTGATTATTGTPASSSTAAGTASTSSGAGTGGSGTGGSGSGSGVGGAAANYACVVPATSPSKGACVTFTAPDGGEGDAGVDDAGNASLTTCDPVTNAGCTGTDICVPDSSLKHYVCKPAGSPGNIPVCGDCTVVTATCGAGLFCVSPSAASPKFYCAQFCCTNADCGDGGTCDTTAVTTPLPDAVGICD